MATYSFNLPDIGEGIAEAEIVAWHVKVGDVIEEDAPLADLMTDKATVEMTSPVAGKVVALNGEVGETIAIGSVLAAFETEGAMEEPSPAGERGLGEGGAGPAPSVQAAPPEAAQVALADPLPEARDGNEESRSVRAASSEVETRPSRTVPDDVSTPHSSLTPTLSRDREREQNELPREHKILASPAVRQRAKDLGIDLGQVKPGQEGRIRHADLDAYLLYNQAGGYRSSGSSAARADEQVKVIGLRRRIAENMAAAKRNIPHFSYVEEIDVTALEAMRADLNANRGDRPKLTMLPFLIVAICKALPGFPMINARYDDEAGIVTRHGAVHLGMATQTDAGLMVPVIRDAQDRNIWQLASEIVRLADAARSGKAKSEELSGSTLTLTSLGPLGGIATTPVINRPEVAIIGPNRVIERPVIKDGEIVAAKLMNLSISCDHRVVDGWDAASFVQALRKLLETPALLFV